MANSNAAKGGFLAKLWVFVKFIIVSLGAFVIQLFLPYAFNFLMSEKFTGPTGIDILGAPYDILNLGIWTSEKAEMAEMAGVGLGLFVSMTLANILAQIFSFFVNREKTFNSCANIKVAFPIYFVITIALIAFSAWLQPQLVIWLREFKIDFLSDASVAISGAICGAVQFFLYFPIQLVLFRKKKEDK